MADTMGLMKTRGEWIAAKEAGDTDLSHKDWYEQKYGSNKTAEQTDKEAQKAIKAGYDKVAMARYPGKGRVA